MAVSIAMLVCRFSLVSLVSMDSCLPQTEDDLLLSPEGIVEKLQDRELRYANLHVVVQWQDRRDGQTISWERCVIDRDSLRRIRYESESGTFDVEGTPVTGNRSLQVFDGLHTGRFDFNYDPVRGQRKGDSTLATVYDRPQPGPDGPYLLRDPSRVMSNNVLSGLTDSIAAGRTVPCRIVESDGLRLVEVEFQPLQNPSPKALRWTAHIDPGRDWAIVEVAGRNSAGVVINATTAVYRADAAGNWLPGTGTWRLFTEQGEESRGWNFLCEEIELRELADNPDLYSIRVGSGSHVYFVPLSVGFVADKELDGFDAIGLAASNAQQQAGKDLLPIAESSPLTANEKTSDRNWLLLANLGALLVLIVALAVKRMRERRRGGDH